MSGRARRWLGGLLAAVLAPGVLVACSGAGPSGSATTIRFGAYVPLTAGFDPTLAQANQLTYLSPVYDTILRQSENGTIEPGLATSWRYESPTRLLLHVRAGVRFTDGEALDAAAVVANLTRMKKSGGALASHLASIRSMETPDRATVRLTLRAPTTSLLATLADITGMVAAPKAFGRLTTHPVGTGPWVYQPKSSSAGASYLFTRNRAYWDRGQRPDKDLRIQVVQNYTSQLNGVQSGQLDLSAIQPSQVRQAKAAGLRLMSTPSARLGMLILDRTGKQVPALGKVGVRQAMNLAVDRAGMAKALTPGYTVPTAGFWLPGYWPASPRNPDRYPYDVDAARRLMKQAGYPKGFTMALGTIPAFQQWATAIQQELKAIGITVRVHILQNGVLGRTIHALTYPAVLTTGGGTSVGDPGTDVQQALLRKSPNNPSHLDDPRIDKLARQGEALRSRARRQPVYRQIDDIVARSAYNVTIGFTATIVAFRPGVRGVQVVPCGGAACVAYPGIRTPS